MTDQKMDINGLAKELEMIIVSLDIPKKEKRVVMLVSESAQSGFWDDNEKAAGVMQELTDIKREVEEVKDLSKEVEAFQELAKSASEQDFAEDLREISKRISALKTTLFMQGKYDNRNAIFSIHAGQGGTEAMDWTSMLYRMYSKFCEKRNWKMATIDISEGEEAGVKMVTFKVVGKYAYGYLKGESGTHRLVRQSPFNADKLRQTSFALVEVLPEIADVEKEEIDLNPDDVDMQFYRSSGHGGQNVNKVSTAVRLTHKPSGIMVTAQTERTQLQNRENAEALLRAKLWVKKQEELKKEKSKIKGDYNPASWGTQIRSYVLHPYKMIKDLRTHIETSDAEGVLDGNLDEFIEAELIMLSKIS